MFLCYRALLNRLVLLLEGLFGRFSTFGGLLFHICDFRCELCDNVSETIDFRFQALLLSSRSSCHRLDRRRRRRPAIGSGHCLRQIGSRRISTVIMMDAATVIVRGYGTPATVAMLTVTVPAVTVVVHVDGGCNAQR